MLRLKAERFTETDASPLKGRFSSEFFKDNTDVFPSYLTYLTSLAFTVLMPQVQSPDYLQHEYAT